MIYTFPSYVPGIAIAVAALAAAIGALLLWRRKPLVLALIALGVSALAGGIIAPTLALDRVVLDDQKLEQTTGLWFAPTVKGFRLTDVTSVTISTARGYNEVWIAKMKNGHSQEVDPGDLWEMNGPDIIERLRAKGIEVIR
jgi:ABC-type Fe3+-siderophore transport system permease subunit